MHANIKTVSFVGIEAIEIDVQIQIINGLPSFTIVGLPDKAVAESRERIRACLFSMGISLPAKRITVNLAPADVQKEGSHYDLPIAIALLTSMGFLSMEDIANTVALGELSLNGSITKVPGVLPASVFAKSCDKILICPEDTAQEAALAGNGGILAPNTLLSLMNHYKGEQILPEITLQLHSVNKNNVEFGCFSDIKGQMMAKRAMEIAASGSHNLIMQGPPGVGKSLLSSRLPSILPPFTAEEALESTMIHSLAGKTSTSSLLTRRPYRAPHHSASLVSMVGGGNNVKPGEISLAHRGVLFLDELPEFSRSTLESLRQPLETGHISIARANNHVTYPARIQLIAAMNPCRCGYMGIASKECSRAPKCGKDYLNKISGPLLDRFDIFIDVPEVKLDDFCQSRSSIEKSSDIAIRVENTRKIQLDRYKNMKEKTNAEISGQHLERYLKSESQSLLYKCIDSEKLSARGYYRILKLSRTLADMEQVESIKKHHIAESMGYRKII